MIYLDVMIFSRNQDSGEVHHYRNQANLDSFRGVYYMNGMTG